MKALSYVLAAIGLLALGYWAGESLTPRLYQAQEKRRFVHDRRPDEPATVEPPYPVVGTVIGMLSIPRLGLSTIVLEGSGERELKLGPGHIPGTALPGGGSNVGVAGHRDTYFRPLRFVGMQDTITVTTHDREYLYKVVSTEIVWPGDTRVLYPTGHETLTLVTCYPFSFVGAASKRFIVRADCANCPRGIKDRRP
jgi:sortase A